MLFRSLDALKEDSLHTSRYLQPHPIPDALFAKLETLQLVRVDWASYQPLLSDATRDNLEAGQNKSLNEMLILALEARWAQGLPSLTHLDIKQAKEVFVHSSGWREMHDLVAEVECTWK